MSILDKINSNDLINPFDITKGKMKGETTVVSKGILSETVKKENELIDKTIKETNNDNDLSFNKRHTTTSQFSNISDSRLIEIVVNNLKNRSDYMTIISEIIYRINNK